MILKRIGPMSLAKISGILYMVLGLFIGLLFALFGLIGAVAGAFSSGETQSPFFGIFFGFGAIFIMPILYGLIGFVMGVVSAALYNIVAGFTGGVELDLETGAGPQTNIAAGGQS